MRKLALILAVLCVARTARADMPYWWMALHGSYLATDATPTLPSSANSATDAPVITAIALPTPTYMPKYVVSTGGGAIVPGSGSGIFAYYSASVYLGQATYATMANEYTIIHGSVETCPLAGVTKALYQYGPLSLGTTGLAGACSSAPAGVIQGFGSYHFGKSAWSALVTATKPFTSGASQAVKLSIGIQWGGN